MIYRSKGLAFFVSLCVSAATTPAVWLFSDSPGGKELLVVFAVSLIAGYFIIYFAVEMFFFRELRHLEEKIRSLDPNGGAETGTQTRTPVQDLLRRVELIVEKKQNEIERLRKLEAFRKEFVADVSHELKTPIFAAQGFVHTLLDGAVKEKDVRKKFLRKAARSLDGLDMLVQDLLTLSQIETGQIKMRFESFDIYALTEEVFEQFKAKVNKKEIVLRIDGPVRKVIVHGDALRIGQVMTNLISNAITYSPEGSEVVVSFSVRKKSVTTHVKDFGEGIAPEHIDRVFERFYRVDKSRSREKGGTGLGLAIVKHILDGHRTKAEVESKPGKGSTFSFKLPKEKQEVDGIREHNTSAKG